MSHLSEPPSSALPEDQSSNSDFPSAGVSEYETDEATATPRWWRKSAKPLLGIGIFAILSTGILFITHMFGGMSGHDMSGHDMGGMDHGMGGHDMGGMSHDDMMRVDGAFNATPVTVEEVQPAPLDASVNYTGAIYPYSEVTVYPRVAGQLSNYDIYPGDRVNAGQLLASLEATERISQTNEAQSRVSAMLAAVEASQLEMEEQQREIDQVQADLDYLRLQRDRFARLTSEGATSQDQYDQVASQVVAKEAMLSGAVARRDRMQAQVVSDQAQANQAQAQVGTATAFESYTQVTAPISGIVQARMADPGVVVQPGMGIFKIGDYQQVRLRANVAQQDANRVQVGTPITAQVPGADSGIIRGEITSIFPQTDMTTRTVTVEAVVDNTDGQLLSGQFVDMEIITARRPRALSVPQQALSEFNGQPALWVVNGETAQRREVSTGMSSGDRIEITSGLKAGDRVITSGHSRLMENSPVAIVDALGNQTDSFVSTAASPLTVELVSPASPKVNENSELVIALKDRETGEAIAISPEDLSVAITMPMKNMAPMSAKADLVATNTPGEFQINTFLGMKGNWILEATATHPEHAGKARLDFSVR